MSGRINYNYYSQNAVNNYFSTYLLSISNYVLSLSGKINYNYYSQNAVNNYYSNYLLSISNYVLSLSGRIHYNYYSQNPGTLAKGLARAHFGE